MAVLRTGHSILSSLKDWILHWYSLKDWVLHCGSLTDWALHCEQS